jgi:hypothetical protein
METPADAIYSILSEVKTVSNNNIENYLEKLLKIGNTSAGRIFGSVACEKEYFILKETVYVLQSAISYYFVKALEKQNQQDFVSCLAYASYAAGINAVLVTKFLPILQRHITFNNSKREMEYIQRINSWLEQEINKLILKTRENIFKHDNVKVEQRLDKTIKTMIALATNATGAIRNLAVILCKKFPAGDFKQARRLYEYVRDEITYIQDPCNVEEVQSPEVTLKLRAGDCDDKAVLLAALLLSIGFETCFFIADTNNDGYPDHVYVGVHLPNAPEIYKPLPSKILDDGRDLHNWIPLDPTCEDSDFGVIPLDDVGILQYIPIVPIEK